MSAVEIQRQYHQLGIDRPHRAGKLLIRARWGLLESHGRSHVRPSFRKVQLSRLYMYLAIVAAVAVVLGALDIHSCGFDRYC